MKHFGPIGHIAIVSKTNLHALQHSDPKTQSEGGQSHGRMQNIFTTSKAVPRNSSPEWRPDRIDKRHSHVSSRFQADASCC
jgi:hypothetical protein